MSLPPRTRVRVKAWPGDPPSTRYGYVAPPGAYRDALVRQELNDDETEWIEIRSATPPWPGDDWVVVWWPGNLWTWELVGRLDIVPE